MVTENSNEFDRFFKFFYVLIFFIVGSVFYLKYNESDNKEIIYNT